MGVISRRPRLPLYAALTVSLVLAACSLLKPAQAPGGQTRSARRSWCATASMRRAAQAYAELRDAAAGPTMTITSC